MVRVLQIQFPKVSRIPDGQSPKPSNSECNHHRRRHRHHHHHLHQHQGIGFLSRSDLRVSRTCDSISAIVGLSPFFLSDGNQTASKEFDKLPF
jgi:hypothetical protein